ncbi:MAG: hypothetical protein R6U96_06025 [Promethearchaeia archaeon]
MAKEQKEKKKKKLRGFAGVIQKQLSPLNDNEKFQHIFEDEEITYLLNATDGRYAALVTVDHGTITVEGIKNKNKKELKKKVLGWDAKMECPIELFLELAMGKLSTWGMLKKIITRKMKIRGPRKLMKLQKMFALM